jgi:glycosyltransferase involved in cell wall biosynthesis
MACIDRGLLRNAIHYITEPYFFPWIRKIVYKRAHLILYRDPEMIQILDKNYYSSSQIIFDFNRVPILDFDKTDLLRKTNDATLKILFLNGFSLDRSPELLIRSIPHILSVTNNVHFIFVGSRNDVEDARVLDLSKELNVEPYVSLYRWNPEPQPFYREASIYVMTAKYIYCNIALLEAMERGLVPIVSNVKDADLIVNDGYNGFVVKDDETELANKIICLYNDREKLKAMGLAARATIQERFNIENRMDLIDTLLAQKGQ